MDELFKKAGYGAEHGRGDGASPRSRRCDRRGGRALSWRPDGTMGIDLAVELEDRSGEMDVWLGALHPAPDSTSAGPWLRAGRLLLAAAPFAGFFERAERALLPDDGWSATQPSMRAATALARSRASGEPSSYSHLGIALARRMPYVLATIRTIEEGEAG